MPQPSFNGCPYKHIKCQPHKHRQPPLTISLDIAPSGIHDQLAAALEPVLCSAPGRPYVVAQLGQTLDGRIATPSGASKNISGPGALDFLHRLRACVDAVVVGAGTVIADDPQLTVRRVPGRNPARAVIDPRGRVPDDARCLDDSDGAGVYAISLEPYPRRRDVQTLCVEAGENGIEPHAIVNALHARGIQRILIEGGAYTVSRFLAAGALDRLYILVAPVLFGSGKPGLQLPPIAGMDEALRPETRTFLLEGGDVLFDCCLRSGNKQ
jgi:diaminohydroxyphosphoribosylaminopyrimidine deaminase/5-amino-6-(5-phosphoribosylamino)uracil reductase